MRSTANKTSPRIASTAIHMIFKINNIIGNNQSMPAILHTVINSPSTKAKNKIKIGLFITVLLLFNFYIFYLFYFHVSHLFYNIQISDKRMFQRYFILIFYGCFPFYTNLNFVYFIQFR